MELGLGLIIGLVVGGIISFLIINGILKKKNLSLVEDMNKKSDLIIKEANITAEKKISEAEIKAEKLIARAESKNESIKQRKIQEAKSKYSKLRSDFEEEKVRHKLSLKEKEMEIVQSEKELNQKEQSLQQRIKNLASKEEDIVSKEQEISTIKGNLTKQLQIVKKKQEELANANERHIKALESVSRLSESEAKEQLLDAVKAKAETEAMAVQKDVIMHARNTAGKEAKKIVIQAIQRMAAEYTIENTVTVFNLESDALKGQIIGREGRNIRALEAATGAEIVVDDTPEAIVISSFDPIRREVCRLSLKKLVADGRIHPGRIEEVVEKVKTQLNEQIIEIGERTIIDLDIHGLHPDLVRMVGRMRYRSSYGQNLLKHSIETANLCALMASELGLSRKQVKMAKRAGLLHDIGKVAEEETELSHAILGMKLCEKAKEHKVICNAVGSHHDEVEMTTILAPIVQACDAISGARPGARREILESYMKRIGELEDLAMSYEGVEKAYALQAGRELRVIVESERITDEHAEDLSFMISQKIQDEMTYPGQIKVMVIRETRSMSIAR